jgi:hypothetical protein
MRGRIHNLLALCLLLFAGCAGPSSPRGGVATIGKAVLSPFKAIGTARAPDAQPKQGSAGKPIEMAGDGSLASITQSDAPGSQSAQNYETQNEEELVFSEPSKITESVNLPNGGFMTRTIHVPAGSKKVTKQSQKVGQTLGVAQKDGTKETFAVLANLRWVQMLGVLAIFAAVFGYAHPIGRKLAGGKDTALVLGGVGTVMVIGPVIWAQYSDYFVAALLVAGAYWFFSRMKYQQGILDSIKPK